MTSTPYAVRFLFMVILGLVLTGCGEDPAPSVGFWKADDRNYIEIQENEGVYSAVVYRPSSWDGTLEKEDFAATYRDGVLSLGLPSGPVPLLYKPDDDVIVIFGDETYARVDAEKTRSELSTQLAQIEADQGLCEGLQSQINEARGTFANNAVCEAFMTPIINQKPSRCRLLYTSCNSF